MAQRAYAGWTASRLGTWKPKAVSLSGAEGNFAKELQNLTAPYLEKPFAVSDAVTLQNQLLAKYPQLRQVRVKRGLFSGRLNISIKYRSPVAQLAGEGPVAHLIDQDGTLYADVTPDPLRTLPRVDIDGENLSPVPQEWVQLIEYAWKNKNSLEIEKIIFHTDSNEVDLYLSDGTKIYFGAVTHSKEKLRRAMQILSKQTPDSAPYRLDFKYFDEGKVFLRQKAR